MSPVVGRLTAAALLSTPPPHRPPTGGRSASPVTVARGPPSPGAPHDHSPPVPADALRAPHARELPRSTRADAAASGGCLLRHLRPARDDHRARRPAAALVRRRDGDAVPRRRPRPR